MLSHPTTAIIALLCFLAGMLVVIIKRDTERQRLDEKLTTTLEDLLASESELEGLRASLSAHQSWLAATERRLGEAQIEVERLKRGDGPNEAA